MQGTRLDPLLPAAVAGPARFAFCSYLDASTHTHAELGERYARSFTAPAQSSPSGVLLSTCHRLEWYQALTGENGAGPLLPEARTVLGHRAVLTRLARIAAGTRSLILGERFIFDQVKAAFTGLAEGHVLRGAADQALRIAVQARQRFRLAAHLDYTDLVRLLLQRTQATPRTLAIIGGGALARALASEFAHERTVLMVTRQPKRLRRHLASLRIPVTALRAADLPAHLDSPHDLVIATIDLEPQYKARICALATAPTCATTIDLCTVPTLDARPAYHHLHHPDVIKTIEDSNRDLIAQVREADAWIEGRVLDQR